LLITIDQLLLLVLVEKLLLIIVDRLVLIRYFMFVNDIGNTLLHHVLFHLVYKVDLLVPHFLDLIYIPIQLIPIDLIIIY